MDERTNQEAPTIVLPNRPPEHSASQENATITGMRWNNDSLFFYMETSLGGYAETIDEDGRTVWKQNKDHAKMNEKGRKAVLTLVKAFVNPSVALTNWTEEQSNEIINQKLHQIHMHLMMSKDDYEIHDADFDYIAVIIDSVVFAQANRPVKGFETKNFHTTIAEHHVQNSSNAPTKVPLHKRIIGMG